VRVCVKFRTYPIDLVVPTSATALDVKKLCEEAARLPAEDGEFYGSVRVGDLGLAGEAVVVTKELLGGRRLGKGVRPDPYLDDALVAFAAPATGRWDADLQRVSVVEEGLALLYLKLAAAVMKRGHLAITGCRVSARRESATYSIRRRPGATRGGELDFPGSPVVEIVAAGADEQLP